MTNLKLKNNALKGLLILCLLLTQTVLQAQGKRAVPPTTVKSLCASSTPVQNSTNMQLADGLRMISHDQGKTWAMAEGKAEDMPTWAQRWLQAPATEAVTGKELSFPEASIKSIDGGKTWTMAKGKVSDLPYWVQPWVNGKKSQQTEQAQALDETLEDPDISYFPNPAGDEVTLRLEMDKNQAVLIELTDLQGRVLRDWNKETSHSGQQEFQLSLQDIPSGLFFIRVEGENVKKQVRLIHTK